MNQALKEAMEKAISKHKTMLETAGEDFARISSEIKNLEQHLQVFELMDPPPIVEGELAISELIRQIAVLMPGQTILLEKYGINEVAGR